MKQYNSPEIEIIRLRADEDLLSGEDFANGTDIGVGSCTGIVEP